MPETCWDTSSQLHSLPFALLASQKFLCCLAYFPQALTTQPRLFLI